MMLHVIWLGAGTQSSTMALMAARREIGPMPLCAIFADTGWEPAAVYRWLDWLETQLPFPVHRVSTGDIRADAQSKRSMPYFIKMPGQIERGQVRRQCTRDYKLDPIERFVRRELLNLKPRQRAPKVPVITRWMGISADEAQRMKPSSEPWMAVRYPLAMELGMTRNDCLMWMERHGYPKPPRSACIGCPYHSDQEWLRMQRETPAEFADAVQFDAEIRRTKGLSGDSYLHSSLKPLGEIDFAANVSGNNLDLWGEECEGMCGV